MTAKTARRVWLAVGLSGLTLLAAAIFTLGSLNTPIELPPMVLFAGTVFVVSAFLVFFLVLARSLVRLWSEQRARQLGTRFKTRMVLGALGISLLPVFFLFFVSYALMNRTLSKWFPRPLEIATAQSQQLLDAQAADSSRQLSRLAVYAVQAPSDQAALSRAVAAGADLAWISQGGKVSAVRWRSQGDSPNLAPHPARQLPGGGDLWTVGGQAFYVGQASLGTSILMVGRRAPPDFLNRLNDIDEQTKSYWQGQEGLRQYKRQILLFLGLVTVLVLFAVTWIAQFLAKSVTVPIQALAEATGEISKGNFQHRVTIRAQDELGKLVNSFNQMARQLGENRRQIEASTQHLESALQEIDRRRQLLTTLLENVPAGVLLLDNEFQIGQANPAVARIFGARGRSARTLSDLLSDEAARRMMRLAHRSRRIGTVSEELEIGAGGRLVHAAVTVSSFGPPRFERGFVVVIDDLTELLRAQKAAAWQEVAQRIAHEIKNPLTPIRLSAERLLRRAERRGESSPGENDFPGVVAECSRLIAQEAESLKSLVDEFSQFARFPAARLAPADLNEIARSAVEVFHNRPDGIRLQVDLAPRPLQVQADAELLRRVIVNLIENAAEAMEGAPLRELNIQTRFQTDSDTAEVTVSDTGHGISPEDKDRLFLPLFSTRGRGTGLGLAIASRIVAEHHGTIRAEDNQPFGTRFVIRLPAAGARADIAEPSGMLGDAAPKSEPSPAQESIPARAKESRS